MMQISYLFSTIVPISGECRPKKDRLGLYPVGVQLFVNFTQIGTQLPSFTGRRLNC